MLVIRAPMRISFAGGGSDLPAFCEEEPGAVLSAALRTFMYVCISKRFEDGVRLAYSKTEIVPSARELEHDIARNALEHYKVQSGIEIVSIADVPAGTGLGSSSAYAVALCYGLGAYLRGQQTDCAETAAYIERNLCGRAIGKQDHYMAMLGGVRYLTFEGDNVGVHTIPSSETTDALQSRLMMFYVGAAHNAAEITERQQANLCARTRQATREMVRIAGNMRDALEAGDLSDFGHMMHEAWCIKRTLADGITSESVDDLYSVARAAGATGGKLCGAGGGGFLLLYVEPEVQDRVRFMLGKWRGLRELPVAFGSGGVKVAANT